MAVTLRDVHWLFNVVLWAPRVQTPDSALCPVWPAGLDSMFVLSYETRLPWTPSNKVLFLDFRGKNKALRTAVLPDTAEMELGGATATRCRQRRHSGLIYTTDINPVPHDCSTTQNTPARLLAHEERRSTGLVVLPTPTPGVQTRGGDSRMKTCLRQAIPSQNCDCQRQSLHNSTS